MKRLVFVGLLTLAASPVAAQAPYAQLTGAERTQEGDTIVLRLSIAGRPAVHVSEPFHLDGRVRLFVDMNHAASVPDSAALAHLHGDDLLAVVPRPRAGGLSLVVDMTRLAEYDVVQDDTTLALRLLALAPPAVAARGTEAALATAPAADRAAQDRSWRNSARERLSGNPALLLGAAPAALLLLALGRRRTPRARPQPATRAATTSTAPATSPERNRGDGRLWAARTLAASGASTADVVRRTGMAREALRFLNEDAPADSAGRGTFGRQQAPVAPRQNGVRTR